MPCLVIVKGILNILRLETGSPGVNILKIDGRPMKKEKRGIKNHVRFKKNPSRIEEQAASIRQNIYIAIRKRILLENRTAKRKNKILRTLARGSRA